MPGARGWNLIAAGVWAVACALGASADVPASQPTTRPAESVVAQAMTVLGENCYSCHNADKKKGGLVLSSRAAALQGGDDGVVLVPGESAKSALVTALAADADPHMPPKQQLTAADVLKLKAWVDAGAAWDERALLASAAPRTVTTRPITLHPLPGFYHPAMALALSPDQKRLAAGRGDRILVFDLNQKSRPVTTELSTPHDLVQSLAWSADGKLLASGGFREVRLWDLNSSTPVRTFSNLPGRVTALAFTADGTLIAGEGEPGLPGVVHAWRVSDGEVVSRWIAHADAVAAIKVSKDGKVLATAGADKMVKTWSLPDGGEVAKFEGHTAQVMAVAFSPDGLRLASAGADKEIKVWDLKTRDQSTSLLTNTAGVTDLSWIDDKHLLSACEDGAVRISVVENRDRAEKTFADAGDVIFAAVAATDGTIYGACQDGAIYAWSAADGKLQAKLPAAEKSVAKATTAPSNAVSFALDVMPVLSRAGCNAGACHAKPQGQNGFKLSVFSYDPKADYRAIVKDARGRRLFPAAPEESLLLRKPTLAVEHKGGKRFERDSDAYRLLVRWIEQGMPYAREGEPTLTAIAVSPKQRRYAKASTQPLAVQATYSDGSTRDVTALADFTSNDKELAKVGEDGVVRVGATSGEGVIVTRFMGLVDVARITVPSDRVLPDSAYAGLPVNNYIDRLNHERLKALGILPSAGCSDSEFVRRSSLDVIGALPTPEETKEFLADESPDKRGRWIDRLLDDPRYGDFWAQKWADLLRPNPYHAGVKAVYVLDEWLRESFRRNQPYDQFAREVVLAQGSTHRDGPVVIYRDRREPADLTTLFSQVFLGVRLECAKCHHHPNEKWSQDDFYQLAAFFGPLKRKGQGISAPISGEPEYVWFAPGGGEVKHPVSGAVMKPRAPDSSATPSDATRDPREALADWLTRPENPFFARAVVNRVWAELMGRGIVQPVDDMRTSNPASNEALLDALAQDFVAHGYDLKQLIRTIARSQTYQLSALPNETNVRDTKNFSRFYRRRPSAEVMLDAVSAVTGVRENLPGVPAGSRAVEAWNNRLDSEFLDAFGRPNASADPPCERDHDGNIVQALHLMNSTRLMNRIADAKGRAAALAKGDKPPGEVVAELYLATLCRYPGEEESKLAAAAFTAAGATRQSATEDLTWALLNSAEFVFNH